MLRHVSNQVVLNEHNAPRVWEHIRRYMNENGPALPWGEQLADTSVPVTWWDSLGAVSVFGPGYIKRWRESWGWMLIMHLLSPLMLPLAILMATTNWVSYKTAYPVAWPQEILDKVGPPLTPEQLHPPTSKEPRARQKPQRKRKASARATGDSLSRRLQLFEVGAVLQRRRSEVFASPLTLNRH